MNMAAAKQWKWMKEAEMVEKLYAVPPLNIAHVELFQYMQQPANIPELPDLNKIA